MIFPSSNVTTADTWRPSAVVSSNSSPSLNFNSMDFKVVEVLIVQTPPSSEISTVGVDTVAAYLLRMLAKASKETKEKRKKKSKKAVKEKTEEKEEMKEYKTPAIVEDDDSSNDET